MSIKLVEARAWEDAIYRCGYRYSEHGDTLEHKQRCFAYVHNYDIPACACGCTAFRYSWTMA